MTDQIDSANNVDNMVSDQTNVGDNKVSPQHTKKVQQNIVFLPNQCKPISEYKQCKEFRSERPDWIMLAKDVNGNGAKSYFCVNINCFGEWYQRQLSTSSPQNLYEVIHTDWPAKLYVDLDYKWSEEKTLTQDELLEQVDLLLDTVSRVAKEWWPNFEPKIASHQDATNDKKFSRHIVYHNLVLGANTEWKPFIQEVLKRSPSLADSGLVDLSVYSSNRLFRLLYSSKYGKTNPLHPLGTPPGAPFDKKELYASLINGYKLDKSDILDLPEGVQSAHTYKPKRQRPPSPGGVSPPTPKRQCYDITSELIQQLEESLRIQNIQSKFNVTISDGGDIWLRPKGGVQQCLVVPDESHQSNGTLVHLDQHTGVPCSLYCTGCSEIIPLYKPASLLEQALQILFPDGYTYGWGPKSSKSGDSHGEIMGVKTECCLFVGPEGTRGQHEFTVRLTDRWCTVECATCQKKRQFNLGETVISLHDTLSFPGDDDIDVDAVALGEGDYFPTETTNQVTNRVIDSLHEKAYENGHKFTFLNMSNMGVGKTVSLSEIIECVLKCYPKTRILVEVSRVSLGGELLGASPKASPTVSPTEVLSLIDLGFKLYSDVHGDLSEVQLLICQLESTHKLIPQDDAKWDTLGYDPTSFDIVIVDEWTAHLSHFKSDTVKGVKGDPLGPLSVLDMACHRWSNAKSLITLCADAKKPQLEVLKQLRPADSIQCVKYTKASSAVHIDYVPLADAQSRAMSALFDLHTKHNLVLHTNSKGVGENFHKEVTKRAKSAEEWERHFNFAKDIACSDPADWATKRLSSILNGIQFLKGDDSDKWYKDNVFKDKKVTTHVPKELYRRVNDEWIMSEQDYTGEIHETRLFMFTPVLLYGSSFDKRVVNGHFTFGVALLKSQSTEARSCVQALSRFRDLKTYLVGVYQTKTHQKEESEPVSGLDRMSMWRRRVAPGGQTPVQFIDPLHQVSGTVQAVNKIIADFTTKERHASKDNLVYEMERVRRNNPGNTSTYYTGLIPTREADKATQSTVALIERLREDTKRMTRLGDPSELPKSAFSDPFTSKDKQLRHDHYRLSQRVHKQSLSYEQLAFLQVFDAHRKAILDAMLPISEKDRSIDSPGAITSYFHPLFKVVTLKDVDQRLNCRLLGVILSMTGFIDKYDRKHGLLASDPTPPPETRLKVLQGLVNLINFGLKKYKVPPVEDSHGYVQQSQERLDSGQTLLESSQHILGVKPDGNPITAPGMYRSWVKLLIKFFDQNGWRLFKCMTTDGKVERIIQVGPVKVKKIPFPRKFKPELMWPLLESVCQSFMDVKLREAAREMLKQIHTWDPKKHSFDSPELVDAFEYKLNEAYKRTKTLVRSVLSAHKDNLDEMFGDMLRHHKSDDPLCNLRVQVDHVRESLIKEVRYLVSEDMDQQQQSTS